MVERILELIKETGISEFAFEKKLGLAQGQIGNWRRRQSNASAGTVIKLANYFNISADYLLGLTDEIAPLKQSSSAENSVAAILPEFIKLSSDWKFVDIVKLYNALPEAYKNYTYGYVTGLAVNAGIDTIKILENKK